MCAPFFPKLIRFGCCYNGIRTLIVFPSPKLIYRHKYLMMKLAYKAIPSTVWINKLTRKGAVLLFMFAIVCRYLDAMIWNRSLLRGSGCRFSSPTLQMFYLAFCIVCIVRRLARNLSVQTSTLNWRRALA